MNDIVKPSYCNSDVCALAAEASQLRDILINRPVLTNDNNKLFQRSGSLDAFVIEQVDYDILQELPLQSLALLDLFKIRVFDLARMLNNATISDVTQADINSKCHVACQTQNSTSDRSVSITENVFELPLKADSEVVSRKQISIFDERLKDIDTEVHHLKTRLATFDDESHINDGSSQNAYRCIFSSQDRGVNLSVKTQLASLEIQLKSACNARREAASQVDSLKSKLEAATKAFYELERKYEIEKSQLQASIEALKSRVAMYDQLEEELNNTIEREAISINSLGTEVEHSGTALVLQRIFGLTSSMNSQKSSTKRPQIPTLALRRLQHSLDLARRLKDAEQKCFNLSSENERLSGLVKVAQHEAGALSRMSFLVSQPTSYLASTLTAKEAQCADLKASMRKVEAKFRRLHAYARQLLEERNAMASDLQSLLAQRQHIRERINNLHDRNDNLNPSGSSQKTCISPSVREPTRSIFINYKINTSQDSALNERDVIPYSGNSGHIYENNCINNVYGISRS